MSAQQVVQVPQEGDELEMLDDDTSAAILYWLETDLVPHGVDFEEWERWMDDGCKWALKANGTPLTAEMLGRWARTGSLR